MVDGFGLLIAGIIGLGVGFIVVVHPRVGLKDLDRQFLLFLEKSHAVGHGNLVVVGVDFVEGEEAVAVAAEFDERRL